MKLEVEIKSTKPMPPRERAVVNLLFTASWLDCQISRSLRPFGLTGPQYNILRILNGSHPTGLSVLEIKSRMLDRSSNVSRLVEKLRLAGLLERIPHDSDRRMVIVTISEMGQKVLSDIQLPTNMAAKGTPGAKMSDSELEELAHLLDKFRG
ncbi:MAG: MarR family transcriptional regulator [Saprospiraceae bacterium]|nr:MarR family transcriptional regulator [Saprospiraceae bacterium]